MKTKILALLLLAGSCAFAGPRISVGIGIGGGYYPYAGYVAPPPVVYAPPVVYPRYYPYGYVRPVRPYGIRPYAGVVVGPRYYGGRYYRGYGRR
jgi:hypothetical protein